MDTFDKFSETSLPPKEAFFSTLTDEGISDADYAHAQEIWKKFHIRTLQQYHNLYLETDVVLLADIFEAFREMSLNYYELDPMHYYSGPGKSWNACLKMTKQPLDLFTDPDKYLFSEKGMRGCVSMISNRHAEANNPYLAQGYDATKETSYITYLDCNNLYGYAMSEPLPTGGFIFLDDNELEVFGVTTKSYEDEMGYILEVDLEYPSHLHDAHNDYPLAPEKIVVTLDMVYKHMKDLSEKLDITLNNKPAKLIPNFYNKTNYVVHGRNLKFYLKMELKLTKIHRLNRICAVKVVDAVYRIQHQETSGGKECIRKGLVQIDEQLGVWQDPSKQSSPS